MAVYDDKLKNVQDMLKKGIVPPRESVRSFLLWFGYERRGFHVVNWIRSKLKQYGIGTKPDFEYAYIDTQIAFIKVDSDLPENEKAGTAIADPTYRIGRLESANRKPVSVVPSAPLEEAVTIMMTNDFSQLPVQTTERDVKGVISWKGIGSTLSLGKQCKAVSDCMEAAHVIEYDDSLLSAIPAIADHDYALVRAHDRTICGIVTSSDFSCQFKVLAEPFLLVGEIENYVRRLIHGKFTATELDAVKDPNDSERAIEGIADLTFGQYIRLLQDEKRWAKIGLKIDRKYFTKRLDEIRQIRNDVMHFDPEGIEESDLALLREFAQFLKKLSDAGII